MSAEKHLQLNMINRRFRPAEGDVDPVSLNHRLKDIKSSTSSSFLKHKQDLLINTVSMSTLLLFFFYFGVFCVSGGCSSWDHRLCKHYLHAC